LAVVIIDRIMNSIVSHIKEAWAAEASLSAAFNRTRLQKIGSFLVSFAATFESDAWKTFPQVDSPEVMWHTNTGPSQEEELERLIELADKNEPRPVS